MLLLPMLLGACELVAAAPAAPPPQAPPPLVDAPPPDPPPTAEPARETVLWITGDLLTSEALRDSMRAGGDPVGAFAEVLADVSELWRAPGDFVIVNLESPVAEVRRNALRQPPPRPGRLAPRRLLMPKWMPSALARAGVDAVTLANNHALDQEREGLVETIDAAHDAGLATLGAGLAPHLLWPAIVGDEGARTAVLSFYDNRVGFMRVEAGEVGLSILGEGSAEQVRRAASENDAVVAIVHVLGELVEQPKSRWRTWAEGLAEAGADLIAVHGTHVPMAFETIETSRGQTLVAWGLGNFVSDMGRRASPRRRDRAEIPKTMSPRVREGLLLRVRVRAGEPIEASFMPTWMSDDRFVLYHSREERELRFALLPLAACGPAASLPPSWPSELRGELGAWIDRRRDHLIAIANLATDGCVPGVPAMLRPRLNPAEGRRN